MGTKGDIYVTSNFGDPAIHFWAPDYLKLLKVFSEKRNTRATPSRPTNAKPSLLCAALANLGHTNKLCFIFPFIALLTGNTVSDRDSCIVIGRTWSNIDWLAGPKIRIVSKV